MMMQTIVTAARAQATLTTTIIIGTTTSDSFYLERSVRIPITAATRPPSSGKQDTATTHTLPTPPSRADAIKEIARPIRALPLHPVHPSGVGSRVQGLGLGFRVQGSRFRVCQPTQPPERQV